MATSYTGQFLSQLSGALPALLNQRKQDSIALVQQQRKNTLEDEDRKTQKEQLAKQNVLDEIIKGLKERELKNATYEDSQRDAGDKALNEFESSKRISTLPISPEYALQPPKQTADSPVIPTSFNPPKYELAQPGMTDLARADKYSLRKYAPFSKSADAVVKNIDAEDKQQFEMDKIVKKGGSGGTNVWTQKNNLYKEHPEAVENLAQQLERLHASGKLDDDIYEQNKNRLIVDPASVDIAMGEYLMKPAIAANTVTATTQPAVTKEYALIAPKSASAGANAKASKIGGAEGETQVNQTAIQGFKPIQGVNITGDSVKKVKNAASQIEMMKKMADDLINKYDKIGSKFTGNDAADYASLTNNLRMMAKGDALFNLGVITGPDMTLLETSLPDASNVKEGVRKEVFGDTSVKLKNFKEMLSQKGDQFYKLNGFEKEQTKQRKVYNPQTGKFELR